MLCRRTLRVSAMTGQHHPAMPAVVTPQWLKERWVGGSQGGGAPVTISNYNLITMYVRVVPPHAAADVQLAARDQHTSLLQDCWLTPNSTDTVCGVTHFDLACKHATACSSSGSAYSRMAS